LDFEFRSPTAVAESSGVITGLSQVENLAVMSPLVTVGAHQPILVKILKNDGESGCGWLYQNPKILRKAKKSRTY